MFESNPLSQWRKALGTLKAQPRQNPLEDATALKADAFCGEW
jgi:hypothetical protein